MLRRGDDGGEICIKIYKKAMVAIVINVVIVLALIVESYRNIDLIREEESTLANLNITEAACVSFCGNYEVDTGEDCCNTQQKCIAREVCRQRKLWDCEQEIGDSKQVIVVCSIMLAISFVFFVIYCCIRIRERRRRQQAREERLMRLLDFIERLPEPNLDAEMEWNEYFLADNTEEICAVCHDKLVNTRVAELRCLHVFHADCIREWFESGDSINTCPICRQVT